MPYIPDGQREELTRDFDFHRLENYVSSQGDDTWPGTINYINARFAHKLFNGVKGRKKYWRFCLFFGTLFMCLLEVYRRVVRDYEEHKTAQNGDVFDDE